MKLIEACLVALHSHRLDLHLVPHSSVVCVSECMCMSEYEVEHIFVAFPPLSLMLLR